MSEVEFKKFAICDTCGVETLCREHGEDDQCGGCYWAPINHAKHQSELAALREELTSRNEVIAMKAREVVEAQTAVTGWAAKCKAAEQRNAELEALLHRWTNNFGHLGGIATPLRDETNAALKPTESGASE